MSDQPRLILTTYEPRRRWFGPLSSRFRLEERTPHKHGITISRILIEGWMPPSSLHEYELVDITRVPQP